MVFIFIKLDHWLPLIKKMGGIKNLFSHHGVVIKCEDLIAPTRYDLRFELYDKKVIDGIDHILFPFRKADGSILWEYVPQCSAYDDFTMHTMETLMCPIDSDPSYTYATFCILSLFGVFVFGYCSIIDQEIMHALFRVCATIFDPRTKELLVF